MENAPCKDCKNRRLYCHSKCEKYRAFDAFRQRERERKHSEQATEQYFFQSKERYKRKTYKKRGGDF